MAVTKLQGCDMYFERTPVRGNRTLLFVHGMGGAVETWVPVRPYFLNEDCIYVDLPGHGRSTGEALTVPETAAVIRSFVEQQREIERVVYVGISYGSSVGLQLPLRSQDLRFEKLKTSLQRWTEQKWSPGSKTQVTILTSRWYSNRTLALIHCKPK